MAPHAALLAHLAFSTDTSACPRRVPFAPVDCRDYMMLQDRYVLRLPSGEIFAIDRAGLGHLHECFAALDGAAKANSNRPNGPSLPRLTPGCRTLCCSADVFAPFAHRLVRICALYRH